MGKLCGCGVIEFVLGVVEFDLGVVKFDLGVVEFDLGGFEVPSCDTITYLGIDFTFGSSLGEDCKKYTQKFTAVVSSVLGHKAFCYESLFQFFFK